MRKFYGWARKMLIKHDKFVKFCLIGCMNAGLSILLYNLFLWLHIHYNAAYALSYLITWINAFYWNGTHVFKASSKLAMVKYFLLYGATFLLGQGILTLQVGTFGWNKTLAQFPVIAVNTFFNYFGSKFWVFKEKKN